MTTARVASRPAHRSARLVHRRGAYDQNKVYKTIAARRPEAAVIVPPWATAVPSAAAEMAPTQRDLHLRTIAQHGRMSWQKSSGYNLRTRVEARVGRFKRVIGDAP